MTHDREAMTCDVCGLDHTVPEHDCRYVGPGSECPTCGKTDPVLSQRVAEALADFVLLDAEMRGHA